MFQNELKELLSIDTFNDTSLFAIYVVDLSTNELVYTNQAMKNIMADMTAKYCWEAIHGQEEPCPWCKAPSLLSTLRKDKQHSKSIRNNGYVIYEHFNEIANKWYQIQEKVVELRESNFFLISFALDISLQKEAQSSTC